VTSTRTALSKTISGKARVTPLVGTFVSASPSGCVIDVGGGRIQARFGSDYLPEVNEVVNIIWINDSPYMMGPVGAKAGQGTVVSVASSLVTLTTDYGTVTCPYGGDAPSAGQIMKITWRAGPFAVAVMSTSPAPNIPPPPPQAATSTHQDVFTALDAGSFNTRWWTGDVRADNSDIGAWFYGSKINDTIPVTAVGQQLQVFVSASMIYGNPPNFGLHSNQTRPAGAPTITSITPVGVSPGWVTLPTSWIDSLKSGGGSAGIGVAHGGENLFRSLAADGQSGALRIVSSY
jgi:hypothetical protein